MNVPLKQYKHNTVSLFSISVFYHCHAHTTFQNIHIYKRYSTYPGCNNMKYIQSLYVYAKLEQIIRVTPICTRP